jgi:hypothetical protein
VPERELELLQFTTRSWDSRAQVRRRMRGHVAEIARLVRLLYNAPDDFGTETMRGDAPCFS